MYYYTYYAKPRASFSMTPEEIKKEIARVQDKRITRESDKPTVVDTNMPCVYDLVNPNIIPLYDEDLSQYYNTFRIPKASGGYRTITAPNPELKQLQRNILKLLTKQLKMLPHNAAHGFTKKRNCKTALQVHQRNGSRWFLKVDIADFFPSCTKDAVKHALRHTYPTCMYSGYNINAIAKYCTLDGALPQGAPTSPMLANLIFIPIDIALSRLAHQNNLVYTRYADDLLFSGRTKFDSADIVEKVDSIINEHGFKMNDSKLRFGSYSGRNWNLGLMYNEHNNITVGYRKKKLLKNKVHNYTSKPEEERTLEEYYSLLGEVGYAKYIEPEYFEPLLDKLQHA